MSDYTERNKNRPFDIIVWGATGFTGALVAEYLAIKAPKDVKFAIAGRSQEKLEAVAKRIAEAAPGSKDITILTAKLDDEASMDKLVSQAKVVISTVGPFALHGEPLVAACVRNRTDYIDSTGEPPFIKNIIEKYHDKAVADGTLIVPSCGFDSIPSDLGTFLLANHFASKGKQLGGVRCSVEDFKGGVSGGTVGSILNIVNTTSYKELAKMADPYYLCPADAARGDEKKAPSNFRYDKDLKTWQSHFIMASANVKYVHRSNALLGNAYGPKLNYTETQGHKNAIAAGATSVGMGIGAAMLMIPPFQWTANWAANKFIPAGSGPTKEQRDNGYFKVKLIGDEATEGGLKAVANVVGHQDPGYAGTSLMLAESALCLVLDRGHLASKEHTGQFAGKVKGGIATAASSMGLALVNRLRKAGMEFDVADL
ncbi:Saccharopine dehydrogenase-domain-containing protein [Fimicolochytrium jonesii]|uniref:Saccharopine dehydrogenase-domain-containing protein n=1 Tax=Fimicolochytrium jonesii TaxID=1396493 RepID=UPI0022FDF228|nr:Saccharopine dehydrogenase-domain-containing protein [Fimicolochytrium jonesii]KAI8820686.1 Saccharopine dehydrogenase-domain-containing protein [Fimicolochytrium jonesii]